MANEFKVKNGLIVIGDLTTSGTITINGALAATQSWVTSQAYLTSASLSGYATQSYVTSAIAALVDSAPAALDTLNELAAALGDDANFSTTITNSIASKQSQLNGTGLVRMSGTSVSYDNTTYLISNFGNIEGDHTYGYPSSEGWYKIAEVVLTSTCQSFNLWGEYRDTGYFDNSHYRIHITARAECDFPINNESHAINVNIYGSSTNDTYFSNNVRVVLTQSSSNYRKYELQYYRATWDTGSWRLQTLGWTTYTTSQTAGTPTGTPRVYYVSKFSTDNIFVSNRISIGTTYAGFAANIAGTTYIIGASAWVNDGYGLTNASSPGTGFFPYSDGTLVFNSANSEKMRVASSGNVGIGTNSPSSPGGFTKIVHISGAYASLVLTSTNVSKTWEIGINAASLLTFFDGSVDRMVINASGNVGIGTTTPANKLVVASDASPTNENSYAIAAASASDFAYKTVIGYDYSNDIGLIAAVRTGIGWRNLSIPQGSLGIGTTSPASKLQVAGDIRIQNETGLITDYGPLVGRYNTSQVYVGTGGSYSIVKIARADGGALNVLSGGNVGIGTDSPNYKLDVNGSINIFSGNSLRWGSGDAEIINSGYSLLFKTYNGSSLAEAMRINSAGKVSIGTTDTNSDKSDFTVYTGSGASLALTDDQVRMGGADVNWGVALRSYGALQTYGQALTLNTQAGNYGVNVQPNGTTVAQFYQDYSYFPGLDFSISRINAAHASNYFRGDASHLVIGTSGTLYLNYGGSTTNITGTTYINGNLAWHAGNDGSGSGLDADTVDGVQADSIVYGNARGTNQSITNNNNDLDKTGYYTADAFTTRPSGVANWMYIEHIKLYNDNTAYQKQLGYDTYDDRMWVRTKSGGAWSSWKQIWTSDSLTNLNQLTNGPGYITGYSETDTLASVTGRGNSTTDRINVRGIGNQGGGNIMMGNVGEGTSKWSYLTGTHYNATSQPQGFALIGGLSTSAYNAVVIGGNIYETNPATEIQFWTHSATTHTAGGTQRGIINSVGNWGIGTASPNQRLSVEGGSIQLNANNVAANYYLYLNKKSGQDGGILFNRDNASDWQLTNGSGNGDLIFYSYGTGTEAITFKRGTGNVGIGVTTPQKKLDVFGSAGIVASIGASIGVGQFAGLHFGYTESYVNNDIYKKSALVFERTDNHGQGGNASGKIHFLLNNIASNSANSLNDSVVTIDSDASGTVGSVRMGIGTRNPSRTLDVNGEIGMAGRLIGYGKNALQMDDSWLRLNQEGHFGSGVYTPGILRNDGAFINYGGIEGYNTIKGRKSQTNNLYTSAALWTESYDNTTTGIAFHISGNVGKFLEMRTDGILYWDNAVVATQSWVSSQSYATTSYVTTQINNLINGAPGALDTLDELAAALGDDANFATTVTNSLASKMPYYHGAITGDPGTAINGVTRIFPSANGPSGGAHFTVFTAMQDNSFYGWQFTTIGSNSYFRSKDTTYTGWYRLWSNADFSSSDISNWTTAYGWGNHASAGYALNSALANYLPLSGGSIGGALTVNGNLTVNGTITENSSLKLKENVETSEGNLEKVVNLRPVTYNKIGSQTTELGLIAEEVAEVYPEFVQYDENGDPIGVHYSRLTAALIGAVKELTNQVQELNKKING